MQFVLFILAFAAAFHVTPVIANPKLCKELSEKRKLDGRAPSECFCGPELSNLQVSLPGGMKLMAVCGLHQGRAINLATEKISLDDYSSKGNYPEGTLFISGQFVRSGTVIVSPGNAGDLFFNPRARISSRKSVFTEHYFTGALKLHSDDHYRKFNAPKPKHFPGVKLECWSATATIKARDFMVEISGTDSQGTYEKHLEVLKVSKYKKIKCD